MQPRDYVITSMIDIESLQSELGKAFAISRTAGKRETLDMYDTFDWRLHHRGWQLFREDGHFRIMDAATGRLISDIEVGSKKTARFGWEFPASAFTDHLKPLLEMRALVHMATFEKIVEPLAVCNSDDKTVAHLAFVSLTMGDKADVVTRCRLLPVKGYSKVSRRIMAFIEALKLMPSTDSAVVELLRRCGIEPGAYSSKINVSLTPEMPAAEAVRLILENLTAVMHQNVEGVLEDIDSEFLHDLRVAIRRARSLLGQTRGVLSAATGTALQKHLKAMGAMTGEVRDLDVYLLKKAAYVAQVPEVLKPGVVQLFRALQNKRRAARGRMVKAMAGNDFKAALRALDDFVQSDALTHAAQPAGLAPIGELARAMISKRFHRVVKKGSRISDATPDERLHELRIECKKLRYLLELFTSLFPLNPMQSLVKQLKQLQDNLGAFNDLSVQQGFLAHYLETVQPKGPHAMLLAAATGGLMTRLAMDQVRVRSEFFSVFQVFCDHENKSRFKTLFS